MKKSVHAPAYTLIEILVTLTIIGILFSFGYASFRDFARRQELAGAAKQLQGDLRLAQQMALSGQKPTTGCGTLSGINFRVESSSCAGNTGSSYAIEFNCSGIIQSPPSKCVDFPKDISVIPPGVNPITFNVLGNGTNLSDDDIIILNQSTINTLSVTVTAGGEIK